LDRIDAPNAQQSFGHMRPRFDVRSACCVDARLLGAEQEAMRDAFHVNQNVHAIINEVRDAKALTDRRLVSALPTKVQRALI
jgi:hypothetical protein